MSEWNFDAFLGAKRTNKWQVWCPTCQNKGIPATKMFEPESLGTVPKCIIVCEGDLNQTQIHRFHS